MTSLCTIDDSVNTCQGFGRCFNDLKCWIEAEAIEMQHDPNRSHFLGHVVTAYLVKPNPKNVAKILGGPRPKTAKQIRQQVAMGSYYRRYVKNSANIVKPMVEVI